MKYEERMPCRYDTENDLVSRLGNTIVRYDSRPVLCIVEGKGKLRLQHPVTRALVADIKPNDPLLDISCPELGYMNLVLATKEAKNRVVYVSRHPYRQWHQGLLSKQLHFDDIAGNPTKEPGWPYSLYLETEGFYDMIVDSYPTLETALINLQKGFRTVFQGGKLQDIPTTEIALSRDVALEKTKSGVFQVYYKTDQVGWTSGDNVVNVRSHEEGWIISRFLQQFKWKVI